MPTDLGDHPLDDAVSVSVATYGDPVTMVVTVLGELDFGNQSALTSRLDDLLHGLVGPLGGVEVDLRTVDFIDSRALRHLSDWRPRDGRLPTGPTVVLTPRQRTRLQPQDSGGDDSRAGRPGPTG